MVLEAILFVMVMPIFVQWKWQKKSKTFLVIFHFYDDFSKANLRRVKKKLIGSHYFYYFLPIEVTMSKEMREKTWKGTDVEIEKSMMTWAPSHTELGLLGDILRYANMIDGLNESTKTQLRYDLEVMVNVGLNIGTNSVIKVDEDRLDDLFERFPNKGKCIFLSHEKDKDEDGRYVTHCCIELCPEYIDYLKEILKPYL
jgi:hypothetical protein